MTPRAQQIAMAILDGFVWYRQRNGPEADDYWGIPRLAYPPEGGIGAAAWKGTVSETRPCTADEIAERSRTGGFYTYADDYRADLNAVARVEAKLSDPQFAAYYAELHTRFHQGAASLRHRQWRQVICATAAQRVELAQYLSI